MAVLIKFIVLILLSTAAFAPAEAAEDVYQSPEIFISESFDGAPPELKTLVVDPALQQKVELIMGTHYRLPDVKYWKKDGRDAWILEAIGKYKPITAGFVVGPHGKMERVKVLVYRESHGWEVKHQFFTRQFNGVALKNSELDSSIDGIAGATLSVNALKKLSALALLLHSEGMAHED